MLKNNDSREVAVAASQFIEERNYWLNKLSGELVKTAFPFNRYRTGVKDRQMETVTFTMTDELFSNVLKLSNTSNPKIHMILTAGLFILLQKYTGNKDIILGTPIYKQQQEGKFINTVLALRNRLEAHLTFKDLLLQVRETITEAVEFQNYPIKRLLDKLNLNSDSENQDFPLFDVAIMLDNIHEKRFIHHINLNMIFSFSRTEQGMAGEVEYNAANYQRSTVTRIVGHFLQLLQAVLLDVNIPVSQIDILTDTEKTKLLEDFNNTDAEIKYSGTIHELFETQVERTPDHIAAISQNPRLDQVSYGELNDRANRLGDFLRKSGVEVESVVALMMEPCLDMAVGLLAILKAGGAYLPIDPGLPQERVLYMLEDSGAGALLSRHQALKDISFSLLQGFESRRDIELVVTPPRRHIESFDRLPRPDRSLINLGNYKNKIGMASVTNCISLQSTRGCPYQCLYCHKIWSKSHVYRSPENIYSEIEYYNRQGVRNFAFIDDCFNLNREKSSQLFQRIVKNKLDLQLFFPNGLRGDVMDPDYIDLMVEAGTRGINLSLETASPRLQKLLKKHLDLDKFKQVMDYIAAQHPKVILEMASMHGFPGETEEEAMMTLNFIKSIRWLHFPYIHILKIFPNTEMEAFALEQGVSKADIMKSKDRAFHELPETLPFPKSFTRKYQADFLNNYFISKERLSHVLPHQMRVLSETALVQKYNAYLPVEINSIKDLIEFAGLEDLQIPPGYTAEKETAPGIFNQTFENPDIKPGTKKILFLDLSQHFSTHSMLYRVVEQPLGALYLLTYLKEKFADQIDGRIYKAGNDFDSYAELKALVDDYRPDLVGIRTLTFFKEFFHETVSMLRQWGVTVPIITGGPYASSDFDTILKDRNVDLVVFGEGEHTLSELIREMLDNNFALPAPSTLDRIQGIAYARESEALNTSRQIILTDRLYDSLTRGNTPPLPSSPGESNLAYVMYTSGSTGKPKGVMVEHRQVNNCISWMQDKFQLQSTDTVVNRTDLTFDPSVWEIFWPLYIGARVKILAAHQRKDAEYLIRLMEQETRLSIMYCPATLVNIMGYLLGSRPEEPRLKLPWLIIGAEPITMEVVKNFYQYYEGQIVNTYGPTECTINNTYYDLDRYDPRPLVPIGKPVANNKIYILDRNLHLVPLGIAGEICIAGSSVARGYIRQKEKTELAFIDNPFGQGKLYKTGDIGRWLEDGNIEIMGRVDEQVKIRGYRIELGEIENALLNHPSISECVVTVKDSSPSGSEIQACKRCGLTSGYPRVTINQEGLCTFCDFYSQVKPFIDNYFKDREQLKQRIAGANRDKRSPYDCLLLYAGGRGAAYALYQLVEMGFKVLALTYDNGYFSKADLANLKKITASLGVDHVIKTHKNSDRILGESIKTAATVCRGCFHTSSALAAEYAYKNGINVVVGATLSRGQIIENKLLMFLQQGLRDEKELEREIAKIQKSAPDIDKNIFDFIDIDVVKSGAVHDTVTFLDFYRYCDVSNRELIDFLDSKDPYWKKRKRFAVYSTNCPIKQIGDYGHLQNKGFHYYGAATSWEKRLGHLTLENLEEDLTCAVTQKAYERFLKRIDYPQIKAIETSNRYLCAYFVPSGENGKTENLEMALVDDLKAKIPSYMMPKYFIQLDKIPLASNGKVDKKALPEPKRLYSQLSATYVAPKTNMEKVIADMWKEVLRVDMVGAKDNFFDLGGSSLDIILVGNKLKNVIKRDVPVVTMFTYPTVHSLAQFLGQDSTLETPAPQEVDRSKAINEGKSMMRQTFRKMKRLE